MKNDGPSRRVKLHNAYSFNEETDAITSSTMHFWLPYINNEPTKNENGTVGSSC